MSDRFKPGDLAWVNHRSEPFRNGFGNWTEPPAPGTPVTIIRRAMCKDYPRIMQRERPYQMKITFARHAATQSWLVLANDQLFLVYDVCLNQRRYKTRKRKSG